MQKSVFRGAWRSFTSLFTKKTPRERLRLKRSYWKLYVAVLVLAIAVPLGLVMMQNAGETEAAWFDQGWSFRKRIPITNGSGSTQTDFQIQLTLDTAVLVTAGKLQSDCDDLRFTDIGGKVLGYWLEPGTCNNANTKVWVKVPSIPSSGADIFFYYGNANSNSQSSTALTFIREIDGVVGAWTLDEPAGNVSDSSGNNYTGTVTGTTSVAGMFGNARSFNGSASSIVTNLTTAFNDFSVVAWFKDDGTRTGYERIADKSFTNCFWLGRNSSVVNSWGGGIRQASDPYGIFITLPDTQWNQIATIRSGTTHYIYGNGASVSNSNTVTNATCSTNSFSIGHHPANTGQNMTGIIDEVRIYNRALSTGELSDLYGAGGDRHGYTTANYPGKELVRKYNTNITLGTIAAEEVGESPVGYWKFDEGQGNTAFDSSTGKHNASISGATWLTEEHCISGKCLQFDGTNDAVDTGFDFGWDESKRVSISMWIKPEDVNAGRKAIIGKKNPDWEWVIYQEATALKLEYWTTAGVHNNGMTSQWEHVLTSNEWVHISYTWDGLTNRFYINGNLVSSHTSTDPSLNQDRSNSMMIGGNIYAWANSYFKGSIDEVKTYAYVRSDAQIKEEYVSGGNAAGAQQQNYLVEGLLGYWKMDEASWNGTAGEVKDSSGNGRHGVRVGDASIGSGRYGNGGSLDGAGDYISVPYHGDVDYFSASIWAYYPTQASYEDDEGLFGTGTSINFQVRRTNTSSNSWRFEIIGENNVASSSIGSCLLTGMSLDEWNFYTVTYDGKTMKGYVNGQQKCSLEVNIGPVRKNNANFFIGNRAGADGFNGKLDEMRIYNRALSNAEIQDLYNYAPKPMAYWKFDEGVGTTAADSSGNGNDGTLNNSASWDVGKVGKAVKLNYDADLNQTVAIPTLNHNYAFTKMAWVKPVTISGCDEARCSIIGPYFEFSGTTLQYYDNGLSTKGWHTGGLSALNTWQHVAVSYDGFSTLRMYIDGKEIINTAVTNVGNHYSNVIGGFSGTVRNFRGLIDEVKIYNYERTPSQIFEDMGGQLELGTSGNSFPQPIAHYKFDEQSGQVVNNSGLMGSSLNGTLGANTSVSTDDPIWKATLDCKSNGCLNFDGTTDTVRVANFTYPNNHTISMWIKPSSASTNEWFFGSSWHYELSIRGGKLVYTTHNGSNYQYCYATTNINDNEFHHILVTYEGASQTKKVYIDGVLEATCVQGSNALGVTTAFTIGGGSYAEGNIDEVKIYNTVLTENQVKQDMNDGSTMSFGTTAAPEANLLSDGAGNPPVAEWKFDEKQGTTTKDVSGNNRTLTLNGTPTWSSSGTCSEAACVHLNGSSQYGTYNGIPIRTAGNQAHTISIWFKTSATSVGPLFQLTGGGTDSAIGWRSGTGNLSSSIYTNTHIYTDASDSYRDGQWHLMTSVLDATSLKLYVDGKLVSQNTNATTANAFNYPANPNLFIGRRAGTSGSDIDDVEYFQGSIDTIKIYNYARTPAQIAYDYNRGAPIAHWKFDECQGSTINDSSGNGLHGSLNLGSGGTQTAIGTCSTSGSAWGNSVNGKYSSGMNFDGTDDWISVPNSSILALRHITVSGWVKPTSCSVNNHLVRKEGSFILSPCWSGNVYLWVQATGHSGWQGLSANTSLPLNEWSHIAATFDGSIRKIYVNGELKNSSNLSGDLLTSSTTLDINGTVSNSEFGSYMADDVRIYSYALSPDQVKQVMNEGSAIRFGPEN